jgi:hypothetical protein
MPETKHLEVPSAAASIQLAGFSRVFLYTSVDYAKPARLCVSLVSANLCPAERSGEKAEVNCNLVTESWQKNISHSGPDNTCDKQAGGGRIIRGLRIAGERACACFCTTFAKKSYVRAREYMHAYFRAHLLECKALSHCSQLVL